MTEFSEMEGNLIFLVDFLISWVAMVMQHGLMRHAKITNAVPGHVNCQIWARQQQRFGH